MSRLENSCNTTVCIRHKCPLKGTTILCNAAFGNQDLSFKDIIAEIESEIARVKKQGEKENKNQKPN